MFMTVFSMTEFVNAVSEIIIAMVFENLNKIALRSFASKSLGKSKESFVEKSS